MIALGAGAALIGAALVYHFASKNQEDSIEIPEMEFDELLTKLKAQQLDTAVKAGNGMIETNYFLRLLQFVGKSTRDTTEEVRKELTDKRRKAYKEGNDEEYERIVGQAIDLEDKAAQGILNQILSHIGVSEMEFGMTH